MEKLLSIVVPVYNVEKYLANCLDSLLNQGLSSEEYEIICVNDGSKDNSAEILSSFSTLNDNIIAVNQENSGVSVARNEGLKRAQGKYVAFCDSDDYFRSGALGKIVREMEKKSFTYFGYE